MRHCLLIDPKAYKAQSIISQCEPNEVGMNKAEILAQELQGFGVSATALVQDVDVVPPGFLEPDSLVIVAVDNRRADILANRLAARMRAPLVKINVEPAYLTVSIRCYDFRQYPPGVCLECQMSDRHYERQLHPLSCDGGTEQATGSPRALSQLAANAGALAIAQLVCSPEHWAKAWWGKQWQQNLLGGQGSFSELHPNPHCRWDHWQSWGEVARMSHLKDFTLAQLAQLAGMESEASLEVEFSGRVATRVVCSECQQQTQGHWWIAELDKPAVRCECGGEAFALPFFAHQKLPAEQLSEVWEQSLGSWGIVPGSILRLSSGEDSRSYCLPGDAEGSPSRAAVESLGIDA
jgi:hypothetical protein